jgi:hypothetical protein
MSEPMTAGRIAAAADEVRARFLVLGLDSGDVDFGRGPDLADAVADLLHHQADAIEALESAGYRDGDGGHDLVIPELRALILAIEAAL